MDFDMPNLKRQRDEFTPKIRLTVAQRAAYLCSNPACQTLTIGPHTNRSKSSNFGVAAHILAAAPGGKRYDPNQTPSERGSIENAIWLCSNCAKKIDTDETRFSVEVLRDWKDDHEKRLENAPRVPRFQDSVGTPVDVRGIEPLGSEGDSGAAVKTPIDDAKPRQELIRASDDSIGPTPESHIDPPIRIKWHIRSRISAAVLIAACVFMVTFGHAALVNPQAIHSQSTRSEPKQQSNELARFDMPDSCDVEAQHEALQIHAESVPATDKNNTHAEKLTGQIDSEPTNHDIVSIGPSFEGALSDRASKNRFKLRPPLLPTPGKRLRPHIPNSGALELSMSQP